MIISSTKMKLTDKFDFGKYNGKLLREVIFNDPDYVRDCLKNIPDFDLTKNADIMLCDSGEVDNDNSGDWGNMYYGLND